MTQYYSFYDKTLRQFERQLRGGGEKLTDTRQSRQDQPQCGRKIDRYKKQIDEREGDGQKQVRQKGVRGEESEREADRH